jgi:ribonuclease P protein component
VTTHFTLGKEERLKSRKAIEFLFKEGKKFSVAPFRIFYAVNNVKGLQFSAGVSVKNFKKAVARNRVKRVTKEAWRLQKNDLRDKLAQHNKGLHVFLVYTERSLPQYGQVYESVGLVLQKLNTVIEQQ